jgi:hypothetical protein
MPELPQFSPVDYPNPPAQPTVNPGVGGLAGAGLAEGAGQVQGVANEWAQRYADARRASDAAGIVAASERQLNDLEFKWSRALNPALADANNPAGKPDMAYSQAGFAKDADALQKKTLDGITDPLVKGHVADRLPGYVAAHLHDVTNFSFGRESSARRGQLDLDLFGQANAAANADTPEHAAMIADDARASIHASVAAGWLQPEEGTQRELQFGSNVQKVKAMEFIRQASQAAADGRMTPLDISNAIADPKNFQGLLPTEREALADQAIRLGRNIISIQTSAEAEKDRAADKALKAAQQSREVELLSDIDAGKPMDPATLTRLGETGEISLGGFQAARAALSKRTADTDDLAIYDHLHRRIMAGEDVGDDILDAQADGLLTVKTGKELLKANTAKVMSGETALDKSNFSTLKTALGGAAIENGFQFDRPETQARARAVWTEAQREWSSRVIVGREDSSKVLSDMLPRLMPMTSQLPDPAVGRIVGPADLQAAARTTYAQHQSGQMPDAQYAEQVRLLNLWRDYLALGGGGSGPAILKPAPAR